MVEDSYAKDNLSSLSICAQDLLHSIQTGIMVLDREGRFLYANQWLIDKVGISVNELTKCTLSSLLAKEDRTEAQRALDSLFSAGQTVGWKAAIHIDGIEKMVAEFTAQPAVRDGAVVAAQVSCLDVTSYHQALSEAAHYRQDLERQQQEANALYSIGASCALTMDLDEVLYLIYAHTSRLFTFSTFAIVLYEASTQLVSAELVIHDGQTMPQRRWSLDEDEGLLGYVIRNAKPMLIRDWPYEADQLPIGEDHFIAPETRSWLSVPLIGKERVLGTICLQSPQVNAFGEAEQRNLYSIADQATMVIENARLYKAQRRRVMQLEAIRDFGQRISSFLNPKELLVNTVELLRERFDYDHVLLFLKDEQKNALLLEAQSPPHLKDADNIVPLDKDQDLLVSWTARQGRSYLANNVEREEKYRPMWHVGSELAVPLLLGDQILGVLDVHRPEVNAFDESDLFILESLSNQVAGGIENSKLYGTVNQQLTEVSTLYMLAEQISSSLETSVVLNSVADILKRVLNCRACVIFLLDENREWLEIQVASGIKQQWRGAKLRIGEGIAGRVAQTAEPIYIPDTHQDPDFIVLDPAVRCMLMVPLIYKGQVIGTLNVDDDKPNAFSKDMDRLLSIAAAQAAVAIQNARLFEALKERAESLAKAHRELLEADRLRSEFVQNMSHELRTPLTFVKGYVEVLLEGTLGELSEVQRDSMQIVSERTDRVIQLVNDILALQEVERGELRFGIVSLDEVAHAEVRSARAIAQQEGLVLIEEFEPDLKPVVGDFRRLDRVFANLIGNAIKFTPSGGKVTVRLANGEGFVRAEVADEGIGIPEDKLEKIFERFYQVDGSSKRRFGGTGLGLAIVQEIIQGHNGEITVESELGVGSTFSFTVPIASDKALRSLELRGPPEE